MKRRKFVVGLGSLAAGGAAATGTGAVSQFESGDRTVEAETVGDASAFIALQPGDAGDIGNTGLSDDGDTRHSNFAELENDKLVLDFGQATSARSGNTKSGNSLGGSGVNPDSTYWFDGVFDIRNLSNNSGSGVGEVQVWIREDIEGVTFYKGSSPGNRTALSADNLEGLSPGQGLDVGVRIVEENLANDDITDTFEVVAQEDGNGLAN